MDFTKSSVSVFVFGVFFFFLLLNTNTTSYVHGDLSYDFYKETCPNAENIIINALIPSFTDDIFTTPSALLRLIFHDCQVQGCDASILVDSGGQSEIASEKNFAIRKREVIGIVKGIVEKECPRQVSCADILVLSAREAIRMAGGPFIRVPLGRRDSISPSSSLMADLHLPSADIGVDEMLPIFINKGLTVAESVAIMGAHSLGVTHCSNIIGRLENKGKGIVSSTYQAILAMNCFGPLNPNNSFFINDPTPMRFDEVYYRTVKAGQGVLRIDTELPSNPRTGPFVEQFASDVNEFFRVFSVAFVKVTSWGVLTGKQGSIREYCNIINE